MSNDKNIDIESSPPSGTDELPEVPSPEGEATPAAAEGPDFAVLLAAQTPESFGELWTKAAERDTFLDHLTRARADQSNLEKRHQRERESWTRYANQRLLGDMLPFLDGLELAVRAPGDLGVAASVVEGVRVLREQVLSVLRNHGLEEVDAVGKKFDPAHHQAIQHLPSAEHASGVVMEQLNKGYRLHDRLLRPAQVIVSRGPARSDPEETPESDESDPMRPA